MTMSPLTLMTISKCIPVDRLKIFNLYIFFKQKYIFTKTQTDNFYYNNVDFYQGKARRHFLHGC